MVTVKLIYNKIADFLGLVLYDEDISSNEVRESKDSSIEKNDYSKESEAFNYDAKQWNAGVFVKSSNNDLVQPHIFDIALDKYGNQEFFYTVEQIKAMVFESYNEDGE